MNEGYIETRISDKIVMMEVPVKDRRIYYIRAKLVDNLVMDISSMNDPIMKIEKISDEKTLFLISTLLNVCGVKEITLDKYEVGIEKGRVFDWEKDGIHNEIIAILEKFQE